MSFTLSGTQSGFLYFNFNPPRIVTGNSESQVVRFTAAAAAATTIKNARIAKAVILTVSVLGLPFFFTLLSMRYEFLERRSLFAPDRESMERGFNDRAALLYGNSAVIALIGVHISMQRGSRTILAINVSLVPLLLVSHGKDPFRVRARRLRKLPNRAREQARREFARAHLKMPLCALENLRSYRDFSTTLEEEAERLNARELAMADATRSRELGEFRGKSTHADHNRSLTVALPLTNRHRVANQVLSVPLLGDFGLESATRWLSYRMIFSDEDPLFCSAPPDTKRRKSAFQISRLTTFRTHQVGLSTRPHANRVAALSRAP